MRNQQDAHGPADRGPDGHELHHRHPSRLRVDVVRTGSVVALAGVMDAATVADARLALQRELDAGTGDLVVDVTHAELHDATGLGVLVGIHRRAARQGRRLVLWGNSDRLDRMLLRTRLHRVLHVERGPHLPRLTA